MDPNRSGAVQVVTGVDVSPLDERTDRADRRLLGWKVAFAMTSLVGAGLWNPLNVGLGRLFPLYVWLAGLVTAIALVWVARWSFRRRALQEIVTAVGALLATAVATASAIVVLWVVDWNHDEEVLATRGLSQLVQVKGWNIIDPVYRVELRRGFGPMWQATVVWQGLPEGRQAAAARFTGPRQVVVTVPQDRDSVCEYTASYDVLTLEPDQVHRDSYTAVFC
jgi:hypothetical protein